VAQDRVPVNRPDVAVRTIAQYYAELGEIDRLTRTPWGRLEYLRTREMIESALPARTCEVLDVGGATGIHAAWLAGAGHRVHVVDPEPAHVEHAARLPGVSASIGDARALDRPDDSADVVLLLGPLYHLEEPADRARTIGEAVRVARTGGLVIGAVIARYASMLDMTALGRLADDATLASVRETARTGRHDPAIGFTTAYFHEPDELRAEFVTAGLEDVAVRAVEGPAYLMLKRADAPEGVSEAVFASALTLARETESHPALMHASSHLLAIGQVSIHKQNG
jgi:SAM-dependent methyltransferase